MLDNIDIKIFGVVGILILLVLGYFVYVLYQDIVFLKKEVVELKQDNKQESWSDEEELDEQEAFSDYEEDDDEEQELELERHLASFMGSQQAKSLQIHSHIEELQPEINNYIHPETLSEDSPVETHSNIEELQITPEPKKENKPKRVYKKKIKTLEPIQEIFVKADNEVNTIDQEKC
jgi:hypothetical protein